MKYCPYCGEKIQENSAYCSNCGATLKEESLKVDSIKKDYVISDNQNNLSSQNTKVNNNTFAIIGFVLSLFSLLTCAITSPFGLIFSIIGLVNAKKYQNNGKEYAIIGIVISTIFVLLLILYFIIILAAASSYSSSSPNVIDAPHY